MTVAACTAPVTMPIRVAMPGAAPMTGALGAPAPAATGGGDVPQGLLAALDQVIAALRELVTALQGQLGRQPIPAQAASPLMASVRSGSGGMPVVGTHVAAAAPAVQPRMSSAAFAPVSVRASGQQPVAMRPIAGSVASAPAVVPAAAPTAAPAAPAAAPVDATPAVRAVQDRASTKGLSAIALRGLAEAHRFGLPLVSGHRPGGPAWSDHTHGNAIDVSTIPIGAASSTEGTPEMKAFAEHMRLAGRAGQLNVKYVILDGRIAAPKDNWEWRPYVYPGKTAAELEALKASNRGEYNRLQHYDHVHVSFG